MVVDVVHFVAVAVRLLAISLNMMSMISSLLRSRDLVTWYRGDIIIMMCISYVWSMILLLQVPQYRPKQSLAMFEHFLNKTPF